MKRMWNVEVDDGWVEVVWRASLILVRFRKLRGAFES